MGGFLGIGKSSEEKEMERQAALKQQEAEQARREAEIRLAEKKAKKGQESATIKLGTSEVAPDAPQEETKKRSGLTQVSNSLGIGKSKTGVQV